MGLFPIDVLRYAWYSKRCELYRWPGWIGILRYRIDCNLFRDCIYRGRLWCNTDYMCSRRKPAWLFGIQCLSGTCVHGRYRITGIGWICCVDSVYAADATDYIDRCIYLSGRGAFCYYSGCKLQDNWKASI